MRRLVASGLALYYAAGGVYMLFDGGGWLSVMIGREIAEPIPFVHFINDVGLAFIASAFGFMVFAARPNYWSAAAVGSAFPLLHAVMHALAMVGGHTPRLIFDLIVIVAPALMGFAVALSWEKHTTERPES